MYLVAVSDRDEEGNILDKGDLKDSVVYAAAITNVFATDIAIGWTLYQPWFWRGVVYGPPGWIAAIVLAGAGVSYLIDPKEGQSNYWGFITGGYYGDQNPNYWDSDKSGSGYFNIPKNINTIKDSLVMDVVQGAPWVDVLLGAPSGNPAAVENEEEYLFDVGLGPI